MFIIQKRQSSICLTELMIVLLAFTLVDSNTSNEMICENSNTRDIHYFKVSSNEFNWTEAWSLCNNSGSTLPIVCDQENQDDLTNFLKATTGSSSVWTAGKRISFSEWKWIDGQPLNSRRVITVPNESYTHVALNPDRSYAAQSPASKTYYLCQYPDTSCNEENEIRVGLTTGCIRRGDEDVSWYEARNRCLRIGGDLANLSDADLDTLLRSNKLNAAHSYWIGLRKNAWYWKRQLTASLHNSDEEIKYSNWASDGLSLSGECISVEAWNGGWKSNSCTEKKTVVCQTRSGGTTSSTSASTISSKKSSNTRSTIPNTTAHSVSNTSGIFIICVVCLIVILIAVVASVSVVTVRRKKRRQVKVSDAIKKSDLETDKKEAIYVNVGTSLNENAGSSVPVYINVGARNIETTPSDYCELEGVASGRIQCDSQYEQLDHGRNYEPLIVYEQLK